MAGTNYYVDPGATADTGDGSIGSPWGPRSGGKAAVQHALDTITRDATNGDQINIKAGTADTLNATINFTTYGTATSAAPIWFRGYTSAANDGGQGEISGGGTYGICQQISYGFSRWADLKAGNSGSTWCFQLGTNSTFVNCEVHGSTTHGLHLSTNSHAVGCWVHDVATTSGNAIYCSSGSIFGCFVDSENTTSIGVGLEQAYAFVSNIVKGYKFGINPNQQSLVANNVVIGTSVASGIGINSLFYQPVVNNIVSGYTGTGAIGIKNVNNGATYIANAVYNCTTKYSLTGASAYESGNQELSSDPFTDSSGQDWSIVEAALISAGYPTGIMRGTDDGAATGTDLELNIGAAMSASGGGGSAGMLRRSTMRGGY